MNRKRMGFTLVELVVVIMILGILAAVAAPKLLNTSATATDNGLRQTLAVIRDAIEMYSAQNGGNLPPGTDSDTFKAALAPYLRGAFPKCPVGAKNDTVAIVSGDSLPLTGDANPTEGWKYNSNTGEFICNSSAASKVDPTVNYDQF